MKLNFDKPLLMGILNITPDSFSDGEKFVDINIALKRIEEMKQEGADIIDIGAESTFGPEAQVSAEEEWGRLEPILSAIQTAFSIPTEVEESLSSTHPRDSSISSSSKTNDSSRNGKKVFISIDTYKSSVAEKALQLGVQMINDVTALRGDPKMIDVLLQYKPYVCLMFSAYETPYAGRENKQYDDVMKTIKEFLHEKAKELMDRGFPREKIIVDPGLGFFLSSDPNLSWEVIDRLAELKSLGFPILVGPSMKSFLGGEIKDRLPKSLDAAEMCLGNGANILRVHQVKETVKLISAYFSHE